jgi:hypothetical protein
VEKKIHISSFIQRPFSGEAAALLTMASKVEFSTNPVQPAAGEWRSRCYMVFMFATSWPPMSNDQLPPGDDTKLVPVQAVAVDPVADKFGRDTRERLIDRDALRYAAMRAGLEPGATPQVLSEWMSPAMVRPPTQGVIQFVIEGGEQICAGGFDGQRFRDNTRSAAWPISAVLRWRYVW